MRPPRKKPITILIQMIMITNKLGGSVKSAEQPSQTHSDADYVFNCTLMELDGVEFTIILMTSKAAGRCLGEIVTCC